jgi:hypothetical protein
MRIFVRAFACLFSIMFLIVLSACGTAESNSDAEIPLSSPPDTSSATTTSDAPTDSNESKDLTAEDYQFEVNSDNTVTITKYIGKGGDIVIPAEIDGKDVTAIGNTFGETGAFQDCSTLTSVIIPDGITEIQDNAFQGCTSLITVTIPASVTLLRNCAFDNCPNLQSVYFEGNAPQLANYVFTATPDLTLYYQEGTTGWTNPFYGYPTETY